MAFNNPFRALKAVSYPNFDPTWGMGTPLSSLFNTAPGAAMRARPGINHPWVYSVISTMLDAYIQCPLRLKVKKDKKGELIDDHPILKLLKSPNPHMSGTNFLEAIVWGLNLTTQRTAGGQSFIWGDEGTNFRKGHIPDELWIQNDLGVVPMVDNRKILQGWRFSYSGPQSAYDYGQKMELDLQEVIRVNLFNPYNILAGVAPGQAVSVGVDHDAMAIEWNGSMLKNGGQSRGVYSPKDKMTFEQVKELKANIEKYVGGTENVGKDRFLPFGLEYNQLTMTPAEMEFMESMGMSKDWILAAHKVSKFAVQQYEDLNYATAKEAKRQLFEQAIIPMHNRIMQEINQAWIDNVGKGDLELCVDMSKVVALHDDLDARYKRAQILKEMGIPPLIALKMNDIPTDDLKAFSWLMENQSATSEALQPPAPVNADKPKPKPGPGKAMRFKVLTEAEKRAMAADYITKVLDPGEVPLAGAVRAFLIGQRNRQLDLVDAWARQGGKAVKAEADETAIDVEEFMLPAKDENIRLAQMMRPHYESTALRAQQSAEDLIRTVTRTHAEIQIQDAAQAFLARRLKRLSEVNRTTFKGLEEKLAEVVARSIANEESRADTAKAIRESIQERYASRERDSKTIARTETAVVSGFVQYNTMKAAGIERKQWLSAHDEKVRVSHNDTEGCGAQPPIPFDEKFENGLDYPSDENGEAKEVINCRCALIPLGPAEEAE